MTDEEVGRSTLPGSDPAAGEHRDGRGGRRVIGLVLGALGLVALGGLFAALVVGPEGSDDPAGLRFADRAEAGAALRLAVEPIRRGQSDAQAAEAATTVIRARAAALGVSGLDVEPGAGGTVQMWVPESAPKGALETLLDPARLSFSNLVRVNSSGGFDTPRAALSSFGTNRVRLPGVTFYVVDPLTGSFLAGPAPTRCDAEAEAGPRMSRQVIVVPPGVMLVRDFVLGGWRMMGRGASFGGAGIIRLEPAPGGVRAILSRPVPHQVGRRGPHSPGPELVLLVEGGARPVPELTGGNRDSDHALTGERSVLFSVPETLRARLVALFAGGESPARVRVDARAATGR